MGVLELLEDAPAATMLCTVLLSAKLVYSFIKEGKLRGGLGGRAPEDVALNPSRTPQQFGELKGPEKLKEKQQRWARICTNDLENIPMGLVIAWGAVVCGVSPNIHVPAIFTFTIARLAHTILYANGSLLRPIAYGVGLAATFTMGVAGVLARLHK